MVEPFKNEFNPTMIAQMALHLKRAWSLFDSEGFILYATTGLESLELKVRIVHISEALAVFLPNDFKQAISVITDALAPYQEGKKDNHEEGITSWATLPLNRYVSMNGLSHFELSMAFFKEATSRFSAEFDIRYFLLNEQERTLEQLRLWASDPHYHVRRLVSEGTRPRLPWGMSLPPFIADPSPILPLLEMLKDDDEEYVRRSVANNLNDIAKDHPDIVLDISKKWLKDATKDRKRLVKHACRTLIKQGHKPILETLGYGSPLLSLDRLDLFSSDVKFGENVEFNAVLRSVCDKPQNLIIDYGIHHRKAKGHLTLKMFKWKTLTLAPQAVLDITKRHPIKKITTRTYYNGTHYVEVFANGVSLGKTKFELSHV